MALILSDLLAKIIKDSVERSEIVPEIWRISKETLKPYLLTAAANYAKVLL